MKMLIATRSSPLAERFIRAMTDVGGSPREHTLPTGENLHGSLMAQ
jgi:hypothetical protein